MLKRFKSWLVKEIFPHQISFTRFDKDFMVVFGIGWLSLLRESAVTAYIVSDTGFHRKFQYKFADKIIQASDYEEAVLILNAAGAFR